MYFTSFPLLDVILSIIWWFCLLGPLLLLISYWYLAQKSSYRHWSIFPTLFENGLCFSICSSDWMDV